MQPVRYQGRPVPLRAGRPQVVQLPPRACRARLLGLLFDTMRTFLLPGALNGIRRLRAYYEQHPGAEVLVVGHADAAGAADYNLELSRQRAEAIAAFLKDDVEAWLPWYRWTDPSGSTKKRWGAREDAHMLSALGDAQGPFYEGPIEEAGPAGRADFAAAVRRFQTWSNAAQGSALVVDGQPGEHTRRALVRAYMAQDGTSLPAGTRLLVHGCGEHHPEVPTADGVAAPENRRVEVFLFEGPIDPPPRDPCPAPGCAERARWIEGCAETVDLRDQLEVPPGRVFLLELLDDPLLPEDTELVVHGLASPLRLPAAAHHRPAEGVYAFPIHDPPPGARCRATLVSTRATQVLFDGVDLSQYVADAVAAGQAPFLPIDLPDEAFQSRRSAPPDEPDPPAERFAQRFEDAPDPAGGERDFPPQPERSDIPEQRGRVN